MATTQALNDLDQAIRDRVQREQEFIDELVEEFKACAQGIQQAANSASPPQDYQPYIDRIEQATNDLESLAPLPGGVNLKNLARTTHQRGVPGYNPAPGGPRPPGPRPPGPGGPAGPPDDSDSDDDGPPGSGLQLSRLASRSSTPNTTGTNLPINGPGYTIDSDDEDPNQALQNGLGGILPDDEDDHNGIESTAHGGRKTRGGWKTKRPSKRPTRRYTRPRTTRRRSYTYYS